MSPTFGELLKQCRKRAGMTQDDLAAATGYSRSLIGAMESSQRLPDLEVLIQSYLPALGLQEEPRLAAQLVESAAAARGERPPAALTLTRERRLVLTKEGEEDEHSLPVPPTELLGRDQEIKQLCHRLLGHSGRLLTLVGPPGVGKTRLAQSVGAALQRVYADGAWFVPLAAVSDPSLVASALLTALQVRDGSARPPETRLIEHLRRKEMLLVLDNFEQIIAAAPLVAELLAECGRLCLLVTSRERLHLRAEQRYRVPPLNLAAAVALFTQRAVAVDPDFVLTETNQPTVEAICQRLDYLPLALELCAAQVDVLSPAQLLAHLQARRLDLLVEGAHDLPPRQRTLRTAIGHSYALLDEEERTLLRSLGIFVSGFAFPEVERVSLYNQEAQTRPLLTVLHALIHKSLVRSETTSTGEQRFFLLETIREFALEQLRTHGEEALLHQRHYVAYLHLFRTGDSHLRGPEAATWLARLEPEQENLRAALQWALDEARYADMAWLLVAAHWFWFLGGHWYEQGRWIAHLLPYRQALDPDLHLAILINLYTIARSLEELQPLERWEGEVLQLLELCPHPLLQAAAWHHIAGTSQFNLPKAADAFERSIALARTPSTSAPLSANFGIVADRDYCLGISLWLYADRLIMYGQFAQAMPLLSESLAIFQARGSRYETINCLGTLGRMALLQGDLTQAHQLLDKAVALSTEFNYKEMLGYLQAFLGLATLYQGKISAACRILCENHILCTDLKDNGLMARNAIYLAETYLWGGLVDEADHWLNQSFALYANPRRIRLDQVERLLVAARLAAAQQQYRRAATLFGLAEQISSRLDYVLAGPRRPVVDTALATVRAALDPDVFAEAFATGQQMSLEEAFATLLAPSHVVGALTKG